MRIEMGSYEIHKLGDVPDLPKDAALCVGNGNTEQKAIDKLYGNLGGRSYISRLDAAALEILVYKVSNVSWVHYEAVLVRKANPPQSSKTGSAPPSRR